MFALCFMLRLMYHVVWKFLWLLVTGFTRVSEVSNFRGDTYYHNCVLQCELFKFIHLHKGSVIHSFLQKIRWLTLLSVHLIQQEPILEMWTPLFCWFLDLELFKYQQHDFMVSYDFPWILGCCFDRVGFG